MHSCLTLRLRTIPTRVGSTPALRPDGASNSDHPHAGGEHFTNGTGGSALTGPSPRGWGAPSSSFPMGLPRRTIPTRVGSTFVRSARPGSSTDHPHAGGEHHSRSRSCRRSCGPSPRGWGALLVQAPNASGDRTIPTRVGSTCVNVAKLACSPDHPHAGGEHSSHSQQGLSGCGPSPRGWGAPTPTVGGDESHRTIPTRVGSTPGYVREPVTEPDHPHAGGEHDVNRSSSVVKSGPSPRGWGARYRLREIVRENRTIPTRVGSTPVLTAWHVICADHPHAGGEHMTSQAARNCSIGPSPRGWGAPDASQCFP